MSRGGGGGLSWVVVWQCILRGCVCAGGKRGSTGLIVWGLMRLESPTTGVCERETGTGTAQGGRAGGGGAGGRVLVALAAEGGR